MASNRRPRAGTVESQAKTGRSVVISRSSSQSIRSMQSTPAPANLPSQKKIKAPSTGPVTVGAKEEDDEEITDDILEGRYWRTKCQLLDQRDAFERELQELKNKLELMSKQRMETKCRTVEYKKMADDITRLELAMDIIDAQMPALLQLTQRKGELETKLVQFTLAINQYLAQLVIVNPKMVKFPTIEAEKEQLMATMQALNADLEHLANSLAVMEKSGMDTDENIMTSVRNILQATNLFFTATLQIKENQELLNQIERMRLTEDSMKAQLALKKEELARKTANPATSYF